MESTGSKVVGVDDGSCAGGVEAVWLCLDGGGLCGSQVGGGRIRRLVFTSCMWKFVGYQRFWLTTASACQEENDKDGKEEVGDFHR